MDVKMSSRQLSLLLLTLLCSSNFLATCRAQTLATTTSKEQGKEFERREKQLHNALMAARSVVLAQNMFPSRPRFIGALTRYNEVPYPLLIGPSMFFLSLFLAFVGYYIRKLVRKLLHSTAERIVLYPETSTFPHVNLYNLQQSKREARLRHEARNTWAWMANKYLLMPHDPNVKATTLSTTWSDFDIPKDVWSIVRAVMKVNGLFQHLKKGGQRVKGQKRKTSRMAELQLPPGPPGDQLEAPMDSTDTDTVITVDEDIEVLS